MLEEEAEGRTFVVEGTEDSCSPSLSEFSSSCWCFFMFAHGCCSCFLSRCEALVLFCLLPFPSREGELKHRLLLPETLHSLIRQQPPALLAHTGGDSSHSIGQKDADFAAADWMLAVCFPAHSASPLSFHSLLSSQISTSAHAIKKAKKWLFFTILAWSYPVPSLFVLPIATQLYIRFCRKAELTAHPTHTHTHFPLLFSLKLFYLSACLSLFSSPAEVINSQRCKIIC